MVITPATPKTKHQIGTPILTRQYPLPNTPTLAAYPAPV